MNTGLINVSLKQYFKREDLVFGVQEKDGKDLAIHPGQFQLEEAADLWWVLELRAPSK